MDLLFVADCGLESSFDLDAFLNDCDNAEIAVALHMAADTIALLDEFDEFNEIDQD